MNTGPNRATILYDNLGRYNSEAFSDSAGPFSGCRFGGRLNLMAKSDTLHRTSGTMLIHIWHVRHVYVYAHMCARARLFVMRPPAAPRRVVALSGLSYRADSPRGV